jgi:hypothetical protein
MLDIQRNLWRNAGSCYVHHFRQKWCTTVREAFRGTPYIREIFCVTTVASHFPSARFNSKTSTCSEEGVRRDACLWAGRKPFPAYNSVSVAILLCKKRRSPRTASVVARSATLLAVVWISSSQERCELSDKIRTLYGTCHEVRFCVTGWEIIVKWR